MDERMFLRKSFKKNNEGYLFLIGLLDMVGIIHSERIHCNKNNEIKYCIYTYHDQELNMSFNNKDLYCSFKVVETKSLEVELENEHYNIPRGRKNNMIAYKNINICEEECWKKFLDKLGAEYEINDSVSCYGKDESIENYKSIWMDERDFNNIGKTRGYEKIFSAFLDDVEKVYKKGFFNSKENKFYKREESKEKLDDRAIAYEEGMKELDELIGLDNLKKDLKEKIASLWAIKKAEELGMPVPNKPTNHMIFVGNPGTGKTVVARIMSKIYYGLGILESKSFIETNRASLIGQYVGQTEKNVKDTFEKVVREGGMLFIDEFHQLFGSDKDYGVNAIQTIVTYLENYRDRFVLIAAGYPEEMRKAIEFDPGLQQRFSSTLEFSDYSHEELFKIFKVMCDKSNIQIINKDESHNIIRKLDKGSNARIIRLLVEKSLVKMSLRIQSMSGMNDEKFKKEYGKITIDDINNAYDEVGIKIVDTKEKNSIGFSV